MVAERILSHGSRLALHGAEIAERRVETTAVVEALDVVEDRRPRLPSGGEVRVPPGSEAWSDWIYPTSVDTKLSLSALLIGPSSGQP